MEPFYHFASESILEMEMFSLIHIWLGTPMGGTGWWQCQARSWSLISIPQAFATCRRLHLQELSATSRAFV